MIVIFSKKQKINLNELYRFVNFYVIDFLKKLIN